MAQKKSIAIIGATERNGEEIANQLSKGVCNLLLISNDKEALDHLSEKMKGDSLKSEISFIGCVKDGCWEADIIIIAVPDEDKRTVAEMMKEVATQKIVVDVSNQENENRELSSILPYSKLVKVSGDFASKEIVISGDDDAVNKPALSAEREILKIFIEAGYHVSIKNNSRKTNVVTINQ